MNQFFQKYSPDCPFLLEMKKLKTQQIFYSNGKGSVLPRTCSMWSFVDLMSPPRCSTASVILEFSRSMMETLCSEDKISASILASSVSKVRVSRRMRDSRVLVVRRTSVRSAMAAVMQALAAQVEIPSVTFIRQFYALPAFVDAYVQLIRPHLLAKDAFLLMSYHGLPERQIDRQRCATACDLKAPCPIDRQAGVPSCYRAECYASSQAIAAGLGLSPDRYQTTFQSRLGRLPWIQPYTDETLSTLRERGIRHLVVVCPAFVADCLETLEEIGMQSREHWMALGGETFTLVPCLNADPRWVQGLAAWIKTQ